MIQSPPLNYIFNASANEKVTLKNVTEKIDSISDGNLYYNDHYNNADMAYIKFTYVHDFKNNYILAIYLIGINLKGSPILFGVYLEFKYVQHEKISILIKLG